MNKATNTAHLGPFKSEVSQSRSGDNQDAGGPAVGKPFNTTTGDRGRNKAGLRRQGRIKVYDDQGIPTIKSGQAAP